MVPESVGDDFTRLFEWFSSKRLPFADPQTLYQYRLNLLKRFPEFLGRAPVLADLADETIAACMNWLVRVKGLSPTSANKLRDNFNAFWSFLARQRIVDAFPEIAEMPEPEKIVVAWSRDQLHRLWNALARQPGHWGPVPANLWWITLHACLWDTASRIGALRAVRWADVDLVDGWLTLQPETSKGKRRGQVLRLHPQTVELMRRLASFGSEPDAECWPFPYARSEYIYTLYRTILEGAQLPTGRDRCFHCVRKSSASWVDAAGGDASRLLGHTDRAITQRHYLDPRIARGSSAADLLFRPGDLPPVA